MKRKTLKYWRTWLGVGLILLFLLAWGRLFSHDEEEASAQFSRQFRAKEEQLDRFLLLQKNRWNKHGLKGIINQKKQPFFIHVYRNDSLKWWNSNRLPVSNFADIHYPTSGLLKKQNGWYYAKVIQLNEVRVAASFLIRSEYPYDNEFLKGQFAEEFSLGFPARLMLDKETGYPVHNQAGQFLFSIEPTVYKPLSDAQSNGLAVMLFVGIVCLLWAGLRKLPLRKNGFNLFIYLGCWLLHLMCWRFDLYQMLNHTRFTDPSLFASSELFPNLWICLMHVVLITAGVILFTNLRFHQTIWHEKIIKLLFYTPLPIILIGFLLHLIQSLVMNSSVPLELERLFQLTYYTFWVLLIIGLIVWASVSLFRYWIRYVLWRQQKWAFALILFYAILFAAINYYYFEVVVVGLSLMPLALLAMIYLSETSVKLLPGFNRSLIQLVVIAVLVNWSLNRLTALREEDERELFASQLATDQDVNTEFNFQALAEKMKRDAFFQKILLHGRKTGVSELRETLERKYFNGFWDRYACDFFLFDEENKALTYQSTEENNAAYLENLIRRHSMMSEINSEVFFIKDYINQLSYVTRIRIGNKFGSGYLTLYCTLRSKRIPEKIGFPRLLISSGTQVFKPLEYYSIARYYKNQLVSINGKFVYPTNAGLFRPYKKQSGTFDRDGYNHYYFRKTPDDLIILSRKLESGLERLTSFSYLFCFFGFFMVLSASGKLLNRQERSNWSFAFKIQLTLISLMSLTLIAFGLGSGRFITSQYTGYSKELIRDKIAAVSNQIKFEMEESRRKDGVNRHPFANINMQQMASVFVTDINLYGKRGNLIVSSRPKIYNMGLISEQMHPLALKRLTMGQANELIHDESIGSLQYLSAYKPLFDEEGNLLAYVNLFHFGEQQGFRNQIENFLIALINSFILLLVGSVVLAVYVSNWVTAPLRKLRQNLVGIRLGKYNKPLDYRADDEIGALVRSYNQKLEDLAYTAEQLATSERESAWREMAKQVAHEIKNPLTPMKLSLQHLSRVYDPNDPASKEKLARVVQSLIEQIDALTTIANEFSNFAKMPVENKSRIELLQLVKNTILVFEPETDTRFILNTDQEAYVVNADRELLLRVCNNLIKNALQAIPEERPGEITIELSQLEDKVRVSVSDNGKGIPVEIRSRIFSPNFTTKTTGTGLGLAMVKQIIENHQGTIWFESEEEIGTRFIFELPLVASA